MGVTRMTLAVSLMALVGVVLLAGCQQPGKVISSVPSVACPTCSQQVVTSRLAGVNFTRMVCPSCKKEYIPPEGFWDTETIAYTCPTCKVMIGTCPDCCKKALPPATTDAMKAY